jgi:DNA polymerase-1
MERLMLLDGNGLIYRGYFALIENPLTTKDGQLVTGVFGFTNIVMRAIVDQQPDYVAVAFDLPKPTFRHERFAEYKATRTRMPDDLREQLPLVREVVAALRIPIYELEGFEADDVIATLVDQAEDAGLETVIVTGDLDMLQVVSPSTRLVVSLRGGVSNTVSYDVARIDERYGLRPEQMIDYKSLKGDPTDNIPGIPGVGEKTAAKLIREAGSLDALYEHLEEVMPEKLRGPLAEHRESVLESREIMRLAHGLPVELDLEAARGFRNYDRETVLRLFRRFEFRTLVDRLPPLAGERPEDAAAALAAAKGEAFPAARGGGVRRPTPSESDLQGLQLSLDFDALGGHAATAPSGDGALRAERASGPPVEPGDLSGSLGAAIADPGRIERLDAAAIADLRGWIASQSWVAAALRKDDPRPLAGTALALGLAAPDGRVVAADGPAAVQELRDLLTSLRVPLVGHDIKPLIVARYAEDPRAEALPVDFDTQIAAYLLNASLRSQTIADVAAERLDRILPPPAAGLPPFAMAGLEALASAAVRESLDNDLGPAGLDRLFREIELPVIPILAQMEATGVALDREALALLDAEFATEIARLELEIHHDVGHEFNLGSPKQLEQVLFYELNLPKGRRTKTGYSTDANVLEELRPAHPMIGKLLDWRTYTKLRSTYIEALPTLLASDDRLHTTFHQAVASTGRLSSSDPNLQNIPIRSELGRRIRRAFVAGDPGRTLLAADYSQIELRILAHVSGDEHLRDAFARQSDIHRETAARVLHKAPEDVTADERSMAKMVNFGLAYGMSDFGLSTRAGISRQEAQTFINEYFAAYPGISYYMIHIKDTARSEGGVKTLLGRRRAIPELEARNPSLRAAGERMAINMPIQGTAADIMKIAMIRVAEALEREDFAARMLLQVHDELVFDLPRDEVDRLAPVIRATMESAMPLDVPLVVDLKVGDSWEGMRPLTRADAIAAEADEPPELEPTAAPLAG